MRKIIGSLHSFMVTLTQENREKYSLKEEEVRDIQKLCYSVYNKQLRKSVACNSFIGYVQFSYAEIRNVF